MKYIELEKAKNSLERLIMDTNHDQEPIEIITKDDKNAVLIASSKCNELVEIINSKIDASTQSEEEIEKFEDEYYTKEEIFNNSEDGNREYFESYNYSEEWYN